jgi:hypothetical protein
LAVGTRLAREIDVISLLHEFLVDLFRQRPTLAPELLHACAGIRFASATAELGSIDLSQVVPTAYRSDAVTVLRDPAGVAVAAVIVEVQLRVDDDKQQSWLLYVAAARASLGCPATLLVLAPVPEVARWASQAIELGHPGFALRPVVIGYRQIPHILDAARAREAPELAVLSAMAHPELETAEAANAGLADLSEDKQKLYWDMILSCLPEHVRQALEARMKGYVYQSDFARKYYSEGLVEGCEQGLRRAIIALVGARWPGLRDELEDRLRGQPEARLMQIITELGNVHDETEVRRVIDQRS